MLRSDAAIMIHMSRAIEIAVSQCVRGRPTQPCCVGEVGPAIWLRSSGHGRSGRHEAGARLDGRAWTSWSPCHGSRAVVEVADLDPLTHATVTVCAWCSGPWEVSFPLDGRGEGAVAVWIG